MKKFISVLTICALCLGLIGCGSSKEKEDNTSTVISVAQQIVEGKLKAPSTADFPWSFEEYKIEESKSDREGFKKYKVTSYVDAENSFGAKIRSNFTVEFDLNSEDKFYTLKCNIE